MFCWLCVFSAVWLSAVVLLTLCWGWSSLCLLWRWASSPSASSTYRVTELSWMTTPCTGEERPAQICLQCSISKPLYIDKSVFSSGFQGHDGGYHSADLGCSDWAHWAAGHSQSFPPQHHPLRRGGFHPAVHAGDCWPHSSGSGGLQRQVRASKQLAYAWSEYSFPATFRQDTWTLFTRGFIFETGFFSGSFLTFSEWLEHFYFVLF